MNPFSPLDLLNFESLLSSEERSIQLSVRKFIDTEVMPYISDWFSKDHFPKHLMKEFGNLGALGSTLNGYDCPGLSQTHYGLIMHEIERADSGIRSAVSVQGALCMYPIYAYGSEELKNKFLPKMTKGELIGCFGLTEPDFGSNPGGMLTSAKKDGKDFVLNGTKMWITNGSVADLAIVWAKNDEEKVIGLVVEKDFPGFQVKDIKNKFSLRASVTSELHFDNCRVPTKNQLQVLGLKGPFSCLNNARFGIAWGAIGAAQACLDEVIQYTKTRIQFDKPLAGFQMIQNKIADMATEITKAQFMTLQLSRLKEKNVAEPYQISICKMNNVRMALQIARTCRDMLGASGITYEYQVARHLLNLESVVTYEGTEDIHKLIIAEKVTGLAAYK